MRVTDQRGWYVKWKTEFTGMGNSLRIWGLNPGKDLGRKRLLKGVLANNQYGSSKCSPTV